MSFFGGALAPGYSASKGGVAQLTKSLAIGVCCRRNSRQRRRAGLDRDAADAGAAGRSARSGAIRRAHAAGPLGDTDDVAEAAYFLCSPAAAFITGVDSRRRRRLRHRRSQPARKQRGSHARSAPRFDYLKKGEWEKAHAIVQQDEIQARLLGARHRAHLSRATSATRVTGTAAQAGRFPGPRRRPRSRGADRGAQGDAAMTRRCDRCPSSGIVRRRSRDHGDSRRRARLGAASAGRVVPAAVAQHRDRRLVQPAARAPIGRAVAASAPDGSSSVT